MGVDERRQSGRTRRLNVVLLCGQSDIHAWPGLVRAVSPWLGAKLSTHRDSARRVYSPDSL